MVRYADDDVVLCRSREEAKSALACLRAWVSANGLTLHPDKTHAGDCRVEGQGFEFLGYRFEAGQRWVRKKSLMSLRDRIRAKTKRNGGHSVDCVAQSDSERLVRLLQTCPSVHLLVNRRLCSPSIAGDAAPAKAPTGPRTMPARSQTLAECFLRRSWAVHDVRSPPIGAPIPMRKQLTGEPVAGKPHTGFGGRGRRSPLPTPIQGSEADV